MMSEAPSLDEIWLSEERSCEDPPWVSSLRSVVTSDLSAQECYIEDCSAVSFMG